MRIAVLLSGGVDSSVALNILKREGHDITAFYLKIWLEDELSYLGDCPWSQDLAFAQAVCQQAGVPLEVVSFQKEYWNSVVAYTISEIKKGRTPNPDIMCNKFIKFGAFLSLMGDQFDKVATGHYAHIELVGNEYQLFMAPDAIKDQTYFLSQLDDRQCAKALFPVGIMSKEKVRALAHEWDVPTKARKDSQGICFLGTIKFSDFIRHHVGTREGSLREYETGREVGTHDGFWYYTIGQRHSIGLSGGPWYVVAKDIAANIVYISRSYHAPEKMRKSMRIENPHWIGGQPEIPGSLLVKLRHGAHMHEALVAHTQEGYTITLSSNDQGIAPGQFAVMYCNTERGMRCLGSAAIIEGI